jgi:DNA-binding IclR family transcriptional regulator
MRTCLTLPGLNRLPRTATGRVLCAAKSGDVVLPGCWSVREWRQLRESIRDFHATVVDNQDAFPGICCVSAPVVAERDLRGRGHRSHARHETNPESS